MLGHHWEPAEGTCIDIRVKHASSENDSRMWLMEVRPRNAEPFRVELGYPGFHENFRGPDRGQTCQLDCDVKRQDAKWDLSDPALSWKTWRNEKANDFKAELKARTWADQPGDQAIPAAGGSPDVPAAQAMAPAPSPAPAPASPAGPGAAMPAFDSVQVISGADAGTALNAIFGGQGADGLAAVQALKHAADPSTRLARLKALHDQGLVTDAEYGAQRQKIIGSL